MKCSLCDKEGIHEHHLIPKFIVSMMNLDINSDLYRIWLCEEHHRNGITASWRKVQEALRKLQGTHDGWFEQQFDDEQWDVINEMRQGHAFIHDIDNCKECNKPMEQLHIKQLIENGAEEGKRHISRYKIMVNLKRKGFSDEQITEKTILFNSKCRPPENENTVKNHIKNSLKNM